MNYFQHICLILILLNASISYAGNSIEESSIEDELIDIDESIDQFEFFGDIQIRSDSVRDLPRANEKDFDRVTSRVRTGFIWAANENIDVGLAVKLNLSSQSNNKTRFNLDNERADDVSLDELFFNYNFTDDTFLQIGQTHFPLRLSPMVWDQDLRPQGISINHRMEIGEFNSIDLVAGAFLGNHLFGDESNIKALQTSLNFNEGKNNSYNIILSYLDFNNLNDLAANELSRTNITTANGSFANDFENMDIQVNFNFNQHSFPVRARIDLINNLAAGTDDFGGRVDLVLGNSIGQKGIELGIATQRIQREAVLAAFNDDDWWFATRMRGTAAWLGYGINEFVRLKASVFTERRDDIAKNNKRALFDLQYTF